MLFNNNIKIAVLLGTAKHTLDVSALPESIQAILRSADCADKEDFLLKALVLSNKYEMGWLVNEKVGE